MDKQFENHSKEKKGKKRFILLIVILACALLTFVGVVAAFYSDFIQESQDMSSGTLKLSGTYEYYLNGTETQLDNLHSLTPGDVIVIKSSISNTGNKSAWVRDIISFNSADSAILPFLKVYKGEFTQGILSGGSDLSGSELTLSPEGKAATSNRIIDGSGSFAETETGEDYDYITSSDYQIIFTVYFLPSATNEVQGKTFGLAVGTQALQFRNNNAFEPDENAWSAVSPVMR